MKKTFIASLLSLFVFLALGIGVVYGQPGVDGGTGPGVDRPTGDDCKPGTICNPFRGGDSLQALLETIINQIILPIGGILVVLAFIYAGFKYVMARGNPTEIKKAHETLLYVAIGSAILLGAWAIAMVIDNTIEQLRR